VFGGRTNRALRVSFRLAEDARVAVLVLRGSRVVRRVAPTARRAGVTHRLRVAAEGLPRGTYTVRVAAMRGPAGGAGGERVVARRL